MYAKYTIFALMASALVMSVMTAEMKMEARMEDSTESPVADLAVIDTELKTSTERPPAALKSEQSQNVQPHTVADFIIHPLIAFKPRAPEENVAGKQADGASSTTPSPWTLFGFNAGQGLGSQVSSSVSNLAGSVSGWLTDRIQLPGLVDSPVRESTTTSTTTTTTTTQRPDVVVRVQHRGSTRRPLIAITNDNRPQRFHNNNNVNFESDEEDDEDFDDVEFEQVNKKKNKRRNNKNQQTKRKPIRDQEDLDDEEEEDLRPVRRPQQKRPQQKRRRRPVIIDDFSDEEEDDDDEASAEHYDDEELEDDANVEVEEEDDNVQQASIRRTQNNNKRRLQQQQRRRLNVGNQRFIVRRVQKPIDSEEVEEDDVDQKFYFRSQNGRPSTKRSQSEANFFQRGQENIINQLRQLTGGRTPAEVGALVRKSTKQSGNKQTKHQPTTLFVNRNGQTVYLAPELLNADDLQLINPQVQQLKQGATKFPQPPLSVPVKRKNAPTQYITIPWSQLGIAPPDQLHSVTEGIQTQPLILNIPASALQTMQNQSLKRKKQPVITAEAVPLLAEASIMDVFKPPKIPHDRHTTDSTTQTTAGRPVIIASQIKPSADNTATHTILPQRIRPGTIVEKAPSSADSAQEASDEEDAPESGRNVESDYMPGLTHHVKPAFAESRYVYGSNASPYLELLKQHGRYAFRRAGRELELAEASESNSNSQVQPANGEQLIPVQIISEPEVTAQPQQLDTAALPLMEAQPQSQSEGVQAEPVVEVQQQSVGDALPANVPVLENKGNESVEAA